VKNIAMYKAIHSRENGGGLSLRRDVTSTLICKKSPITRGSNTFYHSVKNLKKEKPLRSLNYNATWCGKKD